MTQLVKQKKNTEMQEAWFPHQSEAKTPTAPLHLEPHTNPETLQYYMALEQLLGQSPTLTEIIRTKRKA